MPFQLFGVAHWSALGCILLLNVVMVYWGRQASAKARAIWRYSLASLLLLNEATWQLWTWRSGGWTPQYMLPLHLCNLLVLLSAYVLLTKNQLGYEFLYLLGLAGATQALITPDVGNWSFPNIRYFIIFIGHGGIVTAAIYMTLVEGYRPYRRSLWRVILFLNGYMGLIGLVNGVLKSNYLFIAHKPSLPTLLDYLGPWPWYILAMEGIGIGCLILLYMPFYWRDRKQRKG